MKRKILSVVLTLAMALSLLPTVSFAASYGDVPAKHWAAEAIDRWSDYGVVTGDLGKFRPDADMTRGEAASVFAKLLGLTDDTANTTFPDLPVKHWSYSVMNKAANAGIITGIDGGKAGPDLKLDRQTFFIMFARALGLKPQDTTGGLASDGDFWSTGYINALTDKGYVTGADILGNGHPVINAKGRVSRASVLKLLDQTIATYANENGKTYEGTDKGVLLVTADECTVTGKIDTLVIAGGAENATVTTAKAEGSASLLLAAGRKQIKIVNATIGSLNVVAPNTAVDVGAGCAVETVALTEQASGAELAVAAGARVETVETAAADTAIANSGVITAVTVAETATGTEVKAASGSFTGVVETKASGTAVSGSGAVANVVASADAASGTGAASVSTAGTKTTSVADGKATTATTSGSLPAASGTNASAASSAATAANKVADAAVAAATGDDSAPTTTTPTTTGGGGGGSSIAIVGNVYKASPTDNSNPEAVIYGSYTVNATQASNHGYVDVAISMDGLKAHDNANSQLGFWTGFFVEAPAGATQFKYAAPSGSAEQPTSASSGLTPLETCTPAGTDTAKQGVALYSDVLTYGESGHWLYVEWYDSENAKIGGATYKADFSGVKGMILAGGTLNYTDIAIPAGAILAVESGAELNVSGNLTVNGAIIVNDGATAKLASESKLTIKNDEEAGIAIHAGAKVYVTDVSEDVPFFGTADINTGAGTALTAGNVKLFATEDNKAVSFDNGATATIYTWPSDWAVQLNDLAAVTLSDLATFASFAKDVRINAGAKLLQADGTPIFTNASDAAAGTYLSAGSATVNVAAGTVTFLGGANATVKGWPTTGYVAVLESGARMTCGETTYTTAGRYNWNGTSFTNSSALNFSGATIAVFGKPVSELGSVTVTQDVNEIAVSGTLNYINGWTAFSSNASEQYGFYLPLRLAKPDGAIDLSKATISAGATGNEFTYDANAMFGGSAGYTDGDTLVMRVGDGTGDLHGFNVVVDWDGEGSAYDANTYTVDLSGVKNWAVAANVEATGGSLIVPAGTTLTVNSGKTLNVTGMAVNGTVIVKSGATVNLASENNLSIAGEDAGIAIDAGGLVYVTDVSATVPFFGTEITNTNAGTALTEKNVYLCIKDSQKTVSFDNGATATIYTWPSDWSIQLNSGAVVSTDNAAVLKKLLSSAAPNGATGATVKLLDDVTANVVIPNTADITLDLNGFTLTNDTESAPSGYAQKSTIVNFGTLTVTDSSTAKSGTVDNVTHGSAALYNGVGATAVLAGGTFKRSAEAGTSSSNNGGNSWYVICNHGTMTAEDGVTVTDGTGDDGTTHHGYSSLFENGYQNTSTKNACAGFSGVKSGSNSAAVSLTINGGTYSGGLNTIKNDDYGTLTITGGSFQNYAQAAFQNHHVASVSGGTFVADSLYAVLNCGVGNCGYNATADMHQLTISGGTFTGKLWANFGSVTVAGEAVFFSSDIIIGANAILTVDEGARLFIPTDTTMTVDGTLTVDGAIVVQEGATAKLASESKLTLAAGEDAGIAIHPGAKVYVTDVSTNVPFFGTETTNASAGTALTGESGNVCLFASEAGVKAVSFDNGVTATIHTWPSDWRVQLSDGSSVTVGETAYSEAGIYTCDGSALTSVED